MKFTIELVATTGDSDRYNIAGYLEAEQSEQELMTDMIDALKEFLSSGVTDFSDHIIIRDGKIIYSNIPVIACSNILKVLQANLDVKISTVLADNAKFIPTDCSGLFRMELSRLF